MILNQRLVSVNLKNMKYCIVNHSVDYRHVHRLLLYFKLHASHIHNSVRRLPITLTGTRYNNTFYHFKINHNNCSHTPFRILS